MGYQFRFTQEGFSKEYSLDIKYYDLYRLGIISTKRNIPAKYEFMELLKLEFFHNNDLIFEHNLASVSRIYYSGKDLDHIERLDLLDFEFPINKKYKKNIKMRLTVLKPDLELLPYIDSLQIYVAPLGMI